jgi:hypothetical protein
VSVEDREQVGSSGAGRIGSPRPCGPSESPDRRPAENRATRRLNFLREAPAAIDFTPFLTHF